MSESLTAELEQIVEALATEPNPPESASLARVGEHVARSFGVQPDEVAILALVQEGKVLRFVLPEKLQAVGTIPLTSTTALAARTARENRAELINNFAVARHASVFEGVPLGRRQGELIHKIMSAPILMGDRVVGVVQISRKGRTPSDAGPDFTRKELRDLASITSVLSRFLSLCQVP